MFKFNILTVLLFLAVSLAALAQTQTTEDTGIDLGNFKKTNKELGISNDEFTEDFFAGDVWNNYLKTGIVNAFKRSKEIKSKTCSVVTNGVTQMIVCDGVEMADITKVFDRSKKTFEDSYRKGAETYALTKKSKEQVTGEVNPLGTSSTPPVTGSYTSGHFSEDFWDNQIEGSIVLIEQSELQKKTDQYKWGTTNPDITYPWKNTDTPIFLVTDYSEPVKDQPKVIVLPVNTVTDNTVVIKDNPLVINKLENEEENKDVVKDDKKEEKESDCKDKLNLEIAKLLEDDKKNIIGLQFELTILKMASAAIGAKTNTLEGLIKQQSKAIAGIDTGIIDQMNVMYKAHGLSEDASAITEHLKVRSAEATYAKDKRFFNQDSSAFLLAYQKLNPDSGIKDSDISVLWFMEKVSAKAQTQNGKYQIQHNLTNLSTRIAQYTGYITAPKKYVKDDLDEMVKKQKSKMDTEFIALIEDFKKTNLACYNEIFGEGEDDCKVGQVEAIFSELLAIRSKISATDSVSLDAKLIGEVNGARFKISKYVD